MDDMKEAITHVVSMSVTGAVRDTTVQGAQITSGQMLGLVDGSIDCIADSAEECLDQLAEKMTAAGIDLDAVDALSLAEQAGSPKAVNLVLMGKLSKYFDIPQEEWMAAIEQSVPAKFLEMNKKAFALGANA